MLDVGFSEILLTSAIALIVLGPERLPKVARQVGNWLGRARVMARQLSEQLEREVSAEEFLKQQSKPSAAAPANRRRRSPQFNCIAGCQRTSAATLTGSSQPKYSKSMNVREPSGRRTAL